MNISTKSVAYFLISRGFNIFITEETNAFLAQRHICKDCTSPWYMDLTECFLCGSYNPYIYKCNNCNKYFSITGTVKNCPTCRQKLIQCCINDSCLSNTNTSVSTQINTKYKGVFDGDSCFNTAQMHCINCGSTLNKYITFNVKVCDASNVDEINSFLKQNLSQFDIIVIKLKTNSGVKYKTLKPAEIAGEIKEDSFCDEIDLLRFA